MYFSESKLRDSNDEYQKSEHNLNRLKKLVEEKNLAERSELFKQLNAAQDQLFGSEKKNSVINFHFVQFNHVVCLPVSVSNVR